MKSWDPLGWKGLDGKSIAMYEYVAGRRLLA